MEQPLSPEFTFRSTPCLRPNASMVGRDQRRPRLETERTRGRPDAERALDQHESSGDRRIRGAAVRWRHVNLDAGRALAKDGEESAIGPGPNLHQLAMDPERVRKPLGQLYGRAAYSHIDANRSLAGTTQEDTPAVVTPSCYRRIALAPPARRSSIH
jgi:hypothetical protein